MDSDRDQTRETVRRLFPGHFAACEQILERIRVEATDWQGRGLNGTPERIIFAIWARTLKTYASVIHLCEGGFGEQAAMLGRTLFEDLIDAAWTCVNPEDASRNFDEHARFDELFTLAAATKHSQFANDIPELSDDDLKELARLKRRYGDFGEKSWTRLGLHRRLAATDALWSAPDRDRISAWLDVGHRRHNAHLHSTPWALEQTFRGVDADNTAVFRSGPSDAWVAASLYAAAWIVTSTTGLVLRHFESPTATSFSDFASAKIAALRPLTGDEIKNVGRNDPCPCGSGRKFKHCHIDHDPVVR